jgi:hypothetical protein
MVSHMAKTHATPINVLSAGGSISSQAARRFAKKLNIPRSGTLVSRILAVEKQIVPLDFEVAVCFDEDGKELFRVAGDESTVVFSDEQYRLAHRGYLTHNHPNGSFFSIADILTAHALDLCQIRAVAKGILPVVHVIDRPTGGWDEARCVQLVQAEAVRLEQVYRVAPTASNAEKERRDNNVKAGLDRYAFQLVKTLNLTYKLQMLK